MTYPIAPVNATESNQVSILEFATFLLRQRRLIGVCATLTVLAVLGGLALRPRKYSSSASFAPQSVDRMSGLAGLAAQFGVASAGPDPTDSPAFYADLLKTREVLTTVLLGDYRFPTDAGVTTGKLIDQMNIHESSAALQLAKGITEITKLVQVELKSRTGVIGFQVTLRNPVLAQEVAQRFIDEVSRFNLEKRRSKAGAERRFTERRIAEIQQELRDAEDRLQAFLQRNRDYRNSPDLSFQHDRMAQEVEFRRTVLTTVSQSNERARMDEVRDTPVITIMEKPNLPARADDRSLLKFGVVAAILGALVGVGLGFVRDVLARRRETSDPHFRDFSAVLADAREDFLRIAWPFHRRVRT